ncbi:MAG: sugar phosphate isomerase/epimerase family protein [Candidatus Njordarchaeales archaeon]
MRPIYGVSTAILGKYDESIINAVDFAGEKNFDVLEIICEAPEFVPGKVPNEYLREIRRKADDYGLRLQLHAPFYSINLASLDPEVNQMSRYILLKTIEAAVELEAKMITFHLGLCFLPCKLYYEEAMSILLENVMMLVDYANEHSIILAAENRGGRLDIGRSEDLLYVINKLGKPKNLGITFDVVQANVVNDPIEEYLKVKDFVVNSHIRDAPKGKEALLAVGEGEIDFQKLVKLFIDNNFYGPYVFEVSSKERALISRGAFEEIFSNLLLNDDKAVS